MTKTLATLSGLLLAGAATVGLAPSAHASPLSPVHLPVAAATRINISVNVGNYYGRGYAPRAYSPRVYFPRVYAPTPLYGPMPAYVPTTVVSGGYWTTQVRVVPTTVLVGYDAYGNPMYQTQYVQRAYQVWVPPTLVAG